MKRFQNIEKRIFIPALIVAVLLIVPLYIFRDEAEMIIHVLYAFCTQKMGWLYILTCLAALAYLQQICSCKIRKTGGKTGTFQFCLDFHDVYRRGWLQYCNYGIFRAYLLCVRHAFFP